MQYKLNTYLFTDNNNPKLHSAKSAKVIETFLKVLQWTYQKLF